MLVNIDPLKPAPVPVQDPSQIFVDPSFPEFCNYLQNFPNRSQVTVGLHEYRHLTRHQVTFPPTSSHDRVDDCLRGLIVVTVYLRLKLRIDCFQSLSI